MKSWLRNPRFWLAQLVVSFLCIVYAAKNFEHAFPFVDVAVKMDRKGSLVAAQKLAVRERWVPQDQNLRQATSFEIDSSTQNFIELEAGGPAALKKVLRDGVYTPYRWRVRHFAEGKTNETQVEFRPDGTFYGFSEKISENDPGASLSSEQARLLAENAASKLSSLDLKSYRLVARSQEVRTSKRIDHTFDYERLPNAALTSLGAGRYRLRLGVAGDHLVEVSSFIQVPDAFFRRYASMRAANGTIANLALAAILLLYGVCGCGVGLFILARKSALIWRGPLLIAGVIAGLQFFESLNQLPLEWMSYDTAISSTTFLLRQGVNAFLNGLFQFVIVLIPVVAGESLGRRAFPTHPQFWKLFSLQGASTLETLG
ncbi:hypothetical protein WDW37_17425, partial [Bdellovibrionota bacterium FG-1]